MKKYLNVPVMYLLYTYLENNSMLKNTYSPDSTILSSSAANIISRTVVGFAQTTTTVTKIH